MESRPQQARELRRHILSAMVLVHRRHILPLQRWPWPLLAVCDRRRSEPERASIISNFYKTPPCCKQVGFARDLQECVSQAEFESDIVNYEWFFLMIAFLLRMSIASVERRHAVHRVQTRGGTKPWHTFAADSNLAESMHHEAL